MCLTGAPATSTLAIVQPLFCDTALAARIERAEADLMAACAVASRERGFVLPIAGGVATVAQADSPFNKVAGLGFGGIPGENELDALERAFAAAGAPVQVELSALGDPELGALFTGRGYRLVSVENVLGRATDVAPVTPVDGPEVRPSPDGELDTWLDVVVEAGLHADVEGVPSPDEFSREALAMAERDLGTAPGSVRLLAWRDGVPVGGAAFRRAGNGIAQFTGAATLPAHRRRGVQSALLAARLADARAAGCELAVVTTQPGSRSQRNVQRAGFHLLYSRAVLVRGTGPAESP
jgi:GNAT superfamily N-acetyltransferase